ncbi:CDP-diacylglycerol--glycerol-3-phosphate 3-phosphatidyltransferase [Peptostreptococcus canis]|uniref:CDP-diacylglycerol--glycerol-3-phosphate 3-phosphatidyltransferase n=1 Tax=Peptostreptococcus canis TaxID=1159213 RepID=A0ABR6TMW6_9FIRM|nr:CDP-diacylglycerol--glycerol-3-phosphate 3-phosphatidyltransferase [Peptostreptococcus canis]MBC2576739.1 CDP-diacylglycerol--glycerol-3-phosphate 3-phosphatidyltransferase [Peptostreptococcus canis]MBP1998838.1 CDP-diacylglycerol--glycerol-3-phosphate 3-phosphatidyltransferase [Peptostreptococcus canis]
MNLPNKLTLFRIILIPVLVIFMYLPISSKYLISLIIFIIAAITDALDGNIARKYNLITDFGKFMDPLADKLLVIAALICMIETSLVPGWIVLIIISRELSVSIMRAIAAADGKVIAAGTSGKLKTIVQMVSIILLLLGAHLNDNIVLTIGKVLIYLAAALTIYSGYEYFSYNKELFEDR